MSFIPTNIIIILNKIYLYVLKMKAYAVEFLGTLFLVFVILATGHWAAIGLALAVAVFLGGKISGGAYNPAVALALYMKKSLSMNDLAMYIAVQLLGAVVAFYLYQGTKGLIKMK
jgi:aquaporin Z